MEPLGAGLERIGARFEDRSRAVETMAELRERFGLGIADVEIQALGTTRYDEPSAATLLAGQFPARDGEDVVSLICRRGGTIVERRAEPDPAEAMGSIATLSRSEEGSRSQRDVMGPEGPTLRDATTGRDASAGRNVSTR